MSGLTILYRMTGNSQNFARIKLGIKLISDSVRRLDGLNSRAKKNYSYRFHYYISTLSRTLGVKTILVSCGVVIVQNIDPSTSRFSMPRPCAQCALSMTFNH